MKYFGMLRVKNEARWIDRVIKAIQPLCSAIVILDDHSTDGTAEICESLGCIVYRSEFESIHEARDKDYLLELLWQHGAQLGDWVLCIDGDEILHHADVQALRDFAATPGAIAASLRVLYLWDREDQWRGDGVYLKFYRPSFFKLIQRNLTFKRTEHGGNFHCSSVPAGHIGPCKRIGVRLLHLGYLHREDRVRKYRWYNTVDPNSILEDCYRHVAQGDLPEIPASAQLKWAGPLKLLPL